jgi:hypothetical protein
MSEEELIQRLQQLQIEENEIIQQLSAIRSTRQGIQVGDTVKLLTRGVRSKKGELATTTKVTGNSVTVRLLSTGHVTRRHPKNVSKVDTDEQ